MVINFRWENMRSELKNSVQMEKPWLISRCPNNIQGSKLNRKVPCLYLDRFCPGKYDLLKGSLISWASITKKQQKNEFVRKKLAQTVPILVNRRQEGSSETRQNLWKIWVTVHDFYKNIHTIPMEGIKFLRGVGGGSTRPKNKRNVWSLTGISKGSGGGS